MPISSPPRLRACHFLAAIVLGIVVAAGHILPAQPSSRTFAGTVSDSHHEPLAGAVVELQDDDTGSVVSYITSRTGQYVFKRLPAGDDYHISASFRGRHSRSKSLSKFYSKPTRTISLVIKPH